MGVDDEFLQINTLEIEQFAQGYNSSQEVWEALRTNPNFAVIPHGMTTGTNRFADANLLTLEPLVDNFEPFEISLRNKATQEIINVTVIAKTNTAGDSFGVFMDEMRASGAMIINNTVFKTVLPDADLEYFYLQTSKGIDTDKLAKTIENEGPINNYQQTYHVEKHKKFGFFDDSTINYGDKGKYMGWSYGISRLVKIAIFRVIFNSVLISQI